MLWNPILLPMHRLVTLVDDEFMNREHALG